MSAFESCVFSIDRPVVYDLGEIEVAGTVTDVSDDRPFHLRVKSLKAELGTEMAGPRTPHEVRAGTPGGPERDVVDLSAGWKTHPISRYYALTRRPASGR